MVVAAPPGPLSASNEELCDVRCLFGCSRWPRKLYLLASTGRLVRGRCGSSNLCEYCLIQELHVIRRMLTLDALDGPAPEVVAVFGTGLATYDPAPFYRGRAQVMRALKRRWPEASYSCLSEFTTGKGLRSGGQRRPHWNMPLKGIPAGDAPEAERVAVGVWCDNVPDADPAAQYLAPLRDTAAFMRYVANHFTKTSQMPPKGGEWKHRQRFNCSRDYFGDLTRAQARERAWWHLQMEREVVKAQRAGSHDPVGAAQAACDELRNTSWSTWSPAAVEPVPAAVEAMHRAAVNLARWEAMHAS